MSKAPHYKKLHQLLKQQILDGTHQKGSLIPSENQLSKAYGINRMTVRKALDALVNEGLIEKKPGKGSVVVRNRNSLGLLSFKGFSEVVGTTAHQSRSVFVTAPKLEAWPNPFFYHLTEAQLRNGCVHVERLRLVNDQPVMLEDTYVENVGLEALVAESFIDNSLFKTLHLRHQIEVTNLEQDIRAVAAPPTIAEHLRVTAGAPLLHLYRRYTTSRTKFFIYSSLYCNTEHYTIGNNF
ncbi:MAG: GntR family transcriptional regulator [Bacteroidota bacterium]